jgi:hypothetical protein
LSYCGVWSAHAVLDPAENLALRMLPVVERP